MDQRDRLYSCDDHLDLWNLPPTLWTDRLPQALRERGPRVVEEGEQRWWRCDGATIGPSTGPRLAQYSAIGRAGIADDGYRASTPSLRLVDMDRDGIWASVIYGPSILGLPIADRLLRAECLRAYNDWTAEFNAHAPTRLAALPWLPVHEPAAAVAELERVAKLGHRGAIVSPFEFRCGDPGWEALWSAAEATRLPLSFHIGGGLTQVKPTVGSWEMASFSACAPLQMDEPLSMMMYSGALERHPGLRLVLAESGIGWIPYFLGRLDQAAAKHAGRAQDYRLRAKPSELFRCQVWATFEEEPLGRDVIPRIGAGNCMWASDYPHPDSTFPNSRAAIDEAFAGLDAATVRKVTAENCAALYGFA